MKWIGPMLLIAAILVSGCATRSGSRQLSHNANPTTVVIPPGIDEVYARDIVAYTLARRQWTVVLRDDGPVVGTQLRKGVNAKLVVTLADGKATIIDESVDEDGDARHVLAWLLKIEADLEKNFRLGLNPVKPKLEFPQRRASQ